MNLIFEGIKYQLQAKKRHGIHSPFVFELSSSLQSEAMNDRIKKLLNGLSNDLQRNMESFEMEDFGVGSKHLGSMRSIAQLYQKSATKGKYGLLLYKLTKHLNPNTILEFGTSLGVGTLHMHWGNSAAKITTIEGSQKVAVYAEKIIQQFAEKPENIQIISSTFHDYIQQKSSNNYDFIYIDGHHDGKALLEYVELLKPSMTEKTVVLIDDIRWSKSMFESWNLLCKDSFFSVSIDFFRMGCLCVRMHQAKEHFILKI